MNPILEMFEVFGYFFVLIASLWAMWASANVNKTFQRYSSQMSSRRITGAQAALRVLEGNGVLGVQISRTSGNLTDHYDPRNNTVYLSDAVYDSTSTAAIGVAAHECGHAMQHKEGYAPLKLRSAMVPVVNLGSNLYFPIFVS